MMAQTSGAAGGDAASPRYSFSWQPSMGERMRFCATGKSGLGHLRRITNIAEALRKQRPELPLSLLTNAPPAGIADSEKDFYQSIEVLPRAQMSQYLKSTLSGPIIVDTAVLPGLAKVDAPLCLILRETVGSKLEQFRLEQGRLWDLVIVPNPPDEWFPEASTVAARRVEAVGWIYRAPKCNGASHETLGSDRRHVAERHVLIASGGGGSGEAWTDFRQTVAGLIQDLREAVDQPVQVTQALGPRAGADARIAGTDRGIRVGAELHQAFAHSDLVISTAGYNSVLELASTNVPVLLVPISRTFDDQHKRARYWGPRLGLQHDRDDLGRSLHWMGEQLNCRSRRPIVDLGPSGATLAATLIQDLMK